MTYFTEAQWCKLMYVPEKKEYQNYSNPMIMAHINGYNDAIDDMQKGGE